ncbi:hypothetical protein JCM11251_003110 [Rhodosporidiobolus azoricus]
MLVVPLSGPDGRPDDDALESLAHVAHELSKSRGVVAAVGAGVSTSAGIPDFRGSSGVYGPQLRRSPTSSHSSLPAASATSSSYSPTSSTPSASTSAVTLDLPPLPSHGRQKAKSLFSYSSLLQPQTRKEHLQMMAALHDRARAIRKGKISSKGKGKAKDGEEQVGEPTAFHGLLRRLEEGGQLRRLWTQNVDGLEAAAGMGVVDLFGDGARGEAKGKKKGSRKGKEKAMEAELEVREGVSASGWEDPSEQAIVENPSPRKKRRVPLPPSSTSSAAVGSTDGGTVVALHGSLREVVCTVCGYREWWKKRHSKAFRKGEVVECPECVNQIQARLRAFKRVATTRSIPFLRPAIILYDDSSSFAHSTSCSVQCILEADLSPRGPKQNSLDFLLVAGTSLKIPGFKSLVKYCARAVKRQAGLCVIVNRETVGKEWEAIFDYHFVGDTDVFARRVSSFLIGFSPPLEAKPVASPPLPMPASLSPAVVPPLSPTKRPRPQRQARIVSVLERPIIDDVFLSPLPSGQAVEAVEPTQRLAKRRITRTREEKKRITISTYRLPTPPPSSSPASSAHATLSPAPAPSPPSPVPLQRDIPTFLTATAAPPSPPTSQSLPPIAPTRHPPSSAKLPSPAPSSVPLSSPARLALLGPLFSSTPPTPAPEAPKTKHRLRLGLPGSVWLTGVHPSSAETVIGEEEEEGQVGDVWRTLRKAEKERRREEKRREREREERKARKEERRRRRADRDAALLDAPGT